MQKKIRDRDRDRDREETHRETETRTQTGVLGIDPSIKGRESEQYLEMHEDEGEAAIAAAAAAVRKNRTAEEKSSRTDGLARKKRDSAMALLHLGRDTERERRAVRGFRQHGKGPPVQPVTGKEGRPGEGRSRHLCTYYTLTCLPPPHKTEQDPMTEHPIRPDLHPATTVIDQPTSVLKGSHYRAFDISKLCLVVLNVKYWCSVQLGGRGGE